jgi:hypothetical protein
MKRILAISLALIISLLVAIPVVAAPPVVYTGGDDVDYEVTDSVCPGIVVRNHEVFTYRMMVWYDNNGNTLKIESHFSGIDTFYNPANPDVVLSGNFTGVYHYDARTGKEFTTGVPWHITAPGYGTIRLRAGRWSGLEVVHLSGKDSFLSPTDSAQFCSCLSGN